MATKWMANDIPDQSGKIFIITGANSGLGYESTLALAKKNATIVMACRNTVKGEIARTNLLKAVPGAKLEAMDLDLGNLASVRAFAKAFKAKYAKLDVLMNNAGIMIPPLGFTKDGFESQFGTNHLGHFALTGWLLEILVNTPNSRVVTVSSMAHLMGEINFDDLQSKRRYNKSGAYGQSKLANLLFMGELQRKFAAMEVGTISVSAHPGYAATNLQKVNDSPFVGVMLQFGNTVMAQSAAMGALPQLYAATAPDVKGGEYIGPRFFMRGYPTRVVLRDKAKDKAVAQRLWQVSEELTGVHYNVLANKR